MSYAVIALMCGGGFGGVSFGGGGGEEAKCTNDTGVHGHGECRSYGRWKARSHPHVFEMMTITSVVDLAGIEAAGEVEHTDGTRYNYRVVSEDLGGDETAVAAGVAFRWLYPGPVLYGGFELGVAAVSTADGERIVNDDNGAMLTPRISGMLTASAVLGARTFTTPLGPRLPLSLGAEVSGGVRAIQVSAESRHGSCVVEDVTMHNRAMVEARARADLWLDPRMSLGAYAGADVVTGLPSGGMILSGHLRAFDGAL